MKSNFKEKRCFLHGLPTHWGHLQKGNLEHWKGKVWVLVLNSQRSTKLRLRKPGPGQYLGEHLQSTSSSCPTDGKPFQTEWLVYYDHTANSREYRSLLPRLCLYIRKCLDNVIRSWRLQLLLSFPLTASPGLYWPVPSPE